jgi:hypothetical protein
MQFTFDDLTVFFFCDGTPKNQFAWILGQILLGHFLFASVTFNQIIGRFF